MLLYMKVVLVPGWLEQALKHANKPLDTVLDVVSLSDIVSKDDVAFYMDLNRRLLPKLFPELYESMETPNLFPYNNGNNDENIKKLQDYLSRRFESLELEFPTIAPHYAMQLLPLQADEKGGLDGQLPSNYVFELFPLKEGVFGCRALLKNAEKSSFDQDVMAYSLALGVLSTHAQFTALAGTSLFKKYAKLCRKVIPQM